MSDMTDLEIVETILGSLKNLITFSVELSERVAALEEEVSRLKTNVTPF